MYPVTITMDRYNGVYSGAQWLAWNDCPDAVPEGPEGDDVECAEFWRDFDGVVGFGSTPDMALANLKSNFK